MREKVANVIACPGSQSEKRKISVLRNRSKYPGFPANFASELRMQNCKSRKSVRALRAVLGGAN